MGFLGEEPVLTPHLDSLAQKSLVLSNFISNYPVCSPARATLMTGQYAFSNHVLSNVTSRTAPFGVHLDSGAICWSDVLKRQGYSLGYIGKWHLDSPHAPFIPSSNNRGAVKWNEWTPPNRRHGFDFWYSYGTYDVHTKPMYWNTNADRMGFKYVDEWEPQRDVDKAIEFIENKDGSCRSNDKPFGLVVSVNPPHTGYQYVPEKYYDLYRNLPDDVLIKDPDIPEAGTPMGDAYRKNVRYYYACITGVDEQIGRLIHALRQNKLADNTIVLFISDHGNCLGKHDQITKNNIYEESLRVPFVLYWKGRVAARIDNNCLMSYADIYPSLLEMMGLKSLIPPSVEGKSYAQYLLSGKGEFPEYQYFMGHLEVNPNTDTLDVSGGFRGIRTKDFKLAYEHEGDSLRKYLFNLNQDPFELKNIYGQLPEVTEKLNNQLVRKLQESHDPFLKNLQ